MHIHWSTVERLAGTLVPIILEETPLAPLAPYISTGIGLAQQAAQNTQGKPMTNDQKLAFAIEEVHNGVEAANAQAQKEILSQPDVDAALTTAINAVVAAINLKHDTAVALGASIPEGVVLPRTDSGTSKK